VQPLYTFCTFYTLHTVRVGAEDPQPGTHFGHGGGSMLWNDDKRHTLWYMLVVKYFSWGIEKNRRLMAERGISFEEIVFHIERGDVLDVLEHPDQEKYPRQRIFIVNVEGYAYLVPFVEDDREVFLKTVIPSRKATRDYLGGSS
jgi:uncharacterized DUF497 family protein